MQNRNRISVALMGSSLILLLIFQFVWLKNVYEREISELQSQADHLFTNSIRDIQDSLVQHIYLDPLLAGHSADTFHFSNLDIDNEKTTIRSAKSVKILGNHAKARIGSDSTFSLTLRSTEDSVKGKLHKIRSGSISLFIAMSDQETDSNRMNDSASEMVFYSKLEPLLEKRLESAINESPINLPYNLLTDAPMDSALGGIITYRYVDMPSHTSYAIQFPQYKGYVFNRMIPEILFSILLFAGISLAFLFIFRSMRQQQRLNQLKNDFISNVTHELKTPITTVGVAIEALRNFNVLNDPERTEEYLNISQQELNRLSILVDRVLRMSLFERSEPEINMKQLNISDLTDNILHSMKLQFEKHNAVVSLSGGEEELWVSGDKVHLTSVIYNLLDNALKYGGDKPKIDIELSEKNHRVILKVRDYGMGIAAEYRDKIFEKFFRVPTGDRHNIKGHGLGLSYVASVVQKHGGNIHLESQPGKGTCFTVELPEHHE